jgi:hypothetical protein
VGGDAVSADTWIDRVREADAEAEAQFQACAELTADRKYAQMTAALLAIAAELRAARIARRPGMGQK